MQRWVLVGALSVALLSGCNFNLMSEPAAPQEPMVDGSHVEIVTGEPDREKYAFVQDIECYANALNMPDATSQARVILKSKAAAVGADIVKLDTMTTGRMASSPIYTQVVMVGRAFRSKTASAATAPAAAAAAPAVAPAVAPAAPATAPATGPSTTVIVTP